MRVSTSYQYGMYQTQIERASQSYINAQQQVSTGKRIQQMSDDPYGVATSVSLRTLKAHTEQYDKNLTQAKGFLGFTDSALTETYNLMTSAYQLAVSGANSTNDQAGRDSMVRQVEQLQQRLVDLGNSQGPNGQYIFAGQKTDVKPFDTNAAGLQFQGDSSSILVEGSASDNIAVNVPGGKLFADLYSAMDDLKANLSKGDVAAISNTDIGTLQDAMKSVNAQRGLVGAKLQTVAQLTSHNEQRITDLTSGISDVEEVDMSSAITQLTLAQTTYQAALSVTSQANKLSLVDFI